MLSVFEMGRVPNETFDRLDSPMTVALRLCQETSLYWLLFTQEPTLLRAHGQYRGVSYHKGSKRWRADLWFALEGESVCAQATVVLVMMRHIPGVPTPDA